MMTQYIGEKSPNLVALSCVQGDQIVRIFAYWVTVFFR
jgi:hypothetical protein